MADNCPHCGKSLSGDRARGDMFGTGPVIGIDLERRGRIMAWLDRHAWWMAIVYVGAFLLAKAL